MFKSCCSRKKMNKHKEELGDSAQDSQSSGSPQAIKLCDVKNESNIITEKEIQTSQADVEKVNDNECLERKPEIVKEEKLESSTEDSFEINPISKIDLVKKRYSVDYKRNRNEFKRYSVDFKNDSETLEELSRLEKELARTNVDVKPPSSGRRKSVGILKSTTSYSDIPEQRAPTNTDSLSEDDEVFENVNCGTKEAEGPVEPPATPVGRDELALRRHRFFSDLVCAARAAVEHRVRFDPLGPVVADPGNDIIVWITIGLFVIENIDCIILPVS